MEPHREPAVPAADPALVAALARALRAAHPGQEPISAEWSHVATAHAGRMCIGSERLPLPREADELFRKLREQMRDDARGVWFSARIEVPATGAPHFSANYSERVYWNSDSMQHPPVGAAPIPADEEWTAELRRNPRDKQFVPSWIHIPAADPGEFAMLRESLDRLGLPLGAVRLPGEEHATFEGALLVRRLESVFSVDIFDYGQLFHLGTETAERAAGMRAWTYLSSPLPDPVHTTVADLEERALAARPGYQQLAARIRGAGAGGVVTNLAVGVPFDRWGGLDGLYLYAWDTPLAQRALPPSAIQDGAARIGFLANQPVPVQAEFAPAWFDQPGGGIRFRTEHPLRDLVRGGVLSVVDSREHLAPNPPGMRI